MSPKGSPGRQQVTESMLIQALGHTVRVKHLPDHQVYEFQWLDRALTYRSETRSGTLKLHRIGQVGIEVSDSIDDAAEDRGALIPLEPYARLEIARRVSVEETREATSENR